LACIEKGGFVLRQPLPKQLVRPKKSSEIVAGHLRLAIVNGDLGKGAMLPVERDLIESFGVSRATMREALRILETEGLLEVTRGSKGGARITGPTLALAAHAVGMVLQAEGTKLDDVQAARQIIEPPAARMVAERRSPEVLETLHAALDKEREAVGTPEFPFASMRFHETLVQLSGNRTLSTFLFVLHEIHEGVATAMSHKAMHAGLAKTGKTGGTIHARTISTHEQLLELIEAGDGEGAEMLWREYWHWIVPYTHPDEAIVDVLRNLGDPND
jgi:GntR family transcriptional repressor for pyruvate dehydrogenase complex